jgi:hypothetical protein
MISLWEKEYCTTNLLINSIIHTITIISTILINIGPNTKVIYANILGEFLDDMKNGKGILYLSNG